MRFTTFDFSRSAYANAKSNVKNNLTYATGKAWVWKKYLPEASKISLYPIDEPRGGKDYMKTTDVESIIYPTTDWIYDTDITDLATFETIPEYVISGIRGTADEKFLASLRVDGFIDKYKIENDASGIKSSDNTWMALSDARTLLQGIRTDVLADPASFITFIYRAGHFEYIRKTARRNYINYYKNDHVDIFNTSKSGYEYTILKQNVSMVNYIEMTGIDSHTVVTSPFAKPALATTKIWTEHFVLPTEENTRNTFAGIEYIANKVVNYLNTTLYYYENDYVFINYTAPDSKIVKISNTVLLTLLDDAIVKYDLLIAEAGSVLWEAEETVLGMILDKFGALEDIVSMDTDKTSNIYLSFRLSVNMDTNHLADETGETKLSIITNLEEEIPEWKDYCFINYRYEDIKDDLGNVIDNYWAEYTYILDWNKIKNLNNYKFMTLLQAFMLLEVDAVKKKYSLMDYVALAAAVVVAFIAAIPTGGTSLFAAYMLLVGATIVAIGMYTGNNKLIKLGQGIMAVASVVNFVVGIPTGPMSSMQTLQYTLTISNMALGEYRKYKSKEWQQEFNQLSEEIEEVSELQTPLDKQQKVQRFIHGDDLKEPKMISYDDLWVTPYDMYYKL